MKISALEEYGLRCALQLARCRAGDSLSIPDIAELEGLSTAYVAKLLNLLRRSGLVQSVRGRSGGYTLARPTIDLSVAEILAALGGKSWEPKGCDRFSGARTSCVHSTGCSIRSLWGSLDSLVDHLLQNVSLADLLKEGVPAHTPPAREQVEHGAGSSAADSEAIQGL